MFFFKVVFVNPSSSARCTQLPRAVDKVPFYQALKRVRDHIRAHGSIEGIDRSTVTFPDFKLVTAPQKAKKEVKAEPTEGGPVPNSSQPSQQPQPGGNTTQQAAAQPQKKAPAKPKKPRGRPKKDSAASQPKQTNQANNGTNPQQPTPNNMAATVAPQQTNLQAHQSQQQMLSQLGSGGQMPPHQSQQMQSQMPQNQQQMNHFMNGNPMQHMHNEQSEAHQNSVNNMPGQSSQQQMGGNNIKREVLDGTHHDKDLAAVIQQSINMQQSIYQQSMASMMQHQGMNGNGLHPGLMLQMPPQPGSGVKQETPDWSGYGIMPPVTSAPPTTLGAYQQYSFWDYLPHAAVATTGASYMTNPYNGIQAPQIAHQQAVAAAAALQTSVSIAQQQQQQPQQAQAVSAATPQQPQIPTYSSPQNPSSPAMSSQSNLTQASLDSLPKADSASTVANWLQNIPNSSQ